MGHDGSSSPWKQGLRVGVLSFFLAVGVSYVSEASLASLPAVIAFLVVLALIALGVSFDILGTSVTAAAQSPLNAMAAKRVGGARQALWLVKNADRVANFCNDVVGDVTGAVSGAAGTTVALQLTGALGGGSTAGRIIGLVIVGLIAALTVGGKAAGKRVAIRRATDVVFVAGRVIYGLERLTGRTLVAGRRSNSTRRRTT